MELQLQFGIRMAETGSFMQQTIFGLADRLVQNISSRIKGDDFPARLLDIDSS
jgi:hypothetical protein